MPTDLRRINKCTACHAPIVWATTSTGKAMPVDAEPTENGNLFLMPTVDRRWLAIVLGKVDGATAPRERYTSHFATCTEAARFRKPVKAGGRK